MSIEQRIRKGLAANAADVLTPVESDLASVLGRRRTRVRVQVGAAVAASAVIVATPWAALTWLGEDSVSPTEPARDITGSYEADVDAVGRMSDLAGTWTVTLGADGVVEVEPPAGYDGPRAGVGESYRLAGGELTTNLFLGWPGCQRSTPAVGVYRVVETATSLTFEPIDDTCPARARLFDATWEELP